MKAVLLTLVALVLAACHPSTAPVPDGARVDDRNIVGDYEGVLPCADCEGIRTHLSLQPGYRYQMQETYLGKSALVFNDHGSWSLAPDSRRLDLMSSGRRSYARHFHGVSPQQLRALDRNGAEIADTRANLALQRVP